MRAHRRHAEYRADDSGAVLVWVALLTIVLLGVGALAVDLGYAYSVKRQLSSTADSASLAGAQEAGLKFSAPGVGGCGPTLDGLIVAAVNANHAANSPAGSTGNPTTTIVCTDPDGNVATGTDASSITVKVEETSSLGTWFGRVLGSESLAPAATATARVFGSTYLSGLRPFLVCLQDAQDARAAHTAGDSPLFQSYYRKFDKVTQVTPTGLVHAGATWDDTTDVITTGTTNHGLSVGDYVRLENITATAPGVAGSGFFYVVDVPKKKELKVSLTSGGTAVNVTSSGTVDVYQPTADIVGATWNGDTVSFAGHGLTDESSVWVQVVSGTGPSDGNYIVEAEEAQPDTFQLSDGTTVVSASSGVSINVYRLAVVSPGGDGCSPPGSAGNWGYSAFDFTSGDNWQLACLIKYGYGGDPDGSGTKPDGTECTDADPSIPGVDVGTEAVGVPSEGDQGNNLGNADGELIRELIVNGDPILLPVGNNWNAAGGNNAQYDGRGALAVTLCGYALPGNKPDEPTKEYFGSCGDRSLYLQSVADGHVDKDVSLVIQWIYSDWVFGFQGQPSGSADQCPLGTCVASLQLLE